MSRFLLFCCCAVAALAFLPPKRAEACTSIIAGKGAMDDGSTVVTYAADSHDLYGFLQHRPGALFSPGSTRPIYDWDSGSYVGKIQQVARTYSTIGNMNEHQLVITESTFGGRDELVNPEGGLDYGSLIYVTLERAANAREAIRTIGRLVEEYGYRSSGESFSIGDPNEAWLLEIIGKGPGKKGAVWVARRIPEGAVTAHANQARIRTFPLSSPNDCLYSPDVIRFAREKGLFKGRDDEFSFADTYAPLTGQSLRVCEARVWRAFDKVAPSKRLSLDYVLGKKGASPLPLWVVPDKKLGVRDVMALMRDHFEGTPFDLSTGVGAGPYGLPYRWRPLTWKVDGLEHLNERAISTQQTGFSLVAQARSQLPNPIGGLLWFGVDDAATSVYLPIYAGIREVPPSLAEGTATLNRFSWDSAFWVFNWVANFTYSRYRDMIQDVRQVQGELEGGFFERQASVEAAATKLHSESPELARAYLTDYSLKQADQTVKRWRRLGEELLVKYLDGNVKDAHGKALHPPYPDEWYQRIAKEDGAKFRVLHLEGEPVDKDEKGRLVFSQRTELGPLTGVVAQDFPFDTEKLVLLPGNAQCGQLPSCCLIAKEEKAGGKLKIVQPSAPEPPAPPCGAPGRLVRIPKGESRLPED